MAEEFVMKGSNVILGPGVNVARNEVNGSNAEYMSGESPYLGARLVRPWVKAMQSKHVLAVVKHWAFNQQETHRDNVNAIVSPRTKWEVYYPPFLAAVEAGAASAMCAYNLVNGVHACQSSEIELQ